MKFFNSFVYAWQGMLYGLEETNMKFHLVIGLIVVILGLLFSISPVEWIIIILCIALVISVELINTAIEDVCDAITAIHTDSYKKMGRPKDIGAGAVLIISLAASIIGIIVFTPYIMIAIG